MEADFRNQMDPSRNFWIFLQRFTRCTQSIIFTRAQISIFQPKTPSKIKKEIKIFAEFAETVTKKLYKNGKNGFNCYNYTLCSGQVFIPPGDRASSVAWKPGAGAGAGAGPAAGLAAYFVFFFEQLGLVFRRCTWHYLRVRACQSFVS